MEEFDVIVIGSGSGLDVAATAAELGLRTAIVDDGPMGGTCLNRGCIPSKILIHSADVAETIMSAGSFGIKNRGFSVDFKKLVSRVARHVDDEAGIIEKSIRRGKNPVLFKARARFVGERMIQVENKRIWGKRVVIATGTRPSSPSILGLDRVPYLTSNEALRLKKLPKSLTIVGGGYIAAELAHFFGALGTKITIVQRNKLLVPNEDEEIAKAFTAVFSNKCTVLLNAVALEVKKKGKKVLTIVGPAKGKGKKRKVVSDQLLIATGRIPNGDTLDLVKTGVRMDKQGFIVTNDYLETTAQNVWAFGDVAGKFMFKHSANLEAEYIIQNVLQGRHLAVDYTAMPHAVFSSPQVAGVGETEEELKERGASYAKGICRYIDTGMGGAIGDTDGFVKVLVEKKTGRILGCHIMGTDAATLIHEVVVAMRAGLTSAAMLRTVHIHPALSEVVQRAFGSVEW